MIKKITRCFLSIIIIALCAVVTIRADVVDGQPIEASVELAKQIHQEQSPELQDQQVPEVVIPEEPQVPEFIDIFGGISNDELLDQIDAVDSKRKNLTKFEELQLAFAYLKACSVEEIRQHISEHLQANSKRYLVAASVTTLFVATILLCRSLEASISTKSTKSTKSKRSKKSVTKNQYKN